MMKLKLLILLLSVSVFAGCASVSWKAPQQSTAVFDEPPQERQWTPHFFGSFGPVNYNADCPDGTEMVAARNRVNAGTVVVSIFTFNIYTPRVSEYWCE